MNEIIGPLYYVFCSDPDIEWQGVLIIIILYIIFVLLFCIVCCVFIELTCQFQTEAGNDQGSLSRVPSNHKLRPDGPRGLNADFTALHNIIASLLFPQKMLKPMPSSALLI